MATYLESAPEDRTVVANAGALFVAQLVGLVAPLITIPYLARVLGPEGWAPVLMAQALAAWPVMLLEFGFELSGTRAVARSRLTPESTTDVVHSVQSAKVLLTIVGIPVAFAIAWALPQLRSSSALIVATLAYSAFRGLSPLWYFQGVERLRVPVVIDTIARAAAAFGVFWIVRGPADGWLVLGLQAVFSGAALFWLTRRMLREVPLRTPNLLLGYRTLREHFALFACRASAGLYVHANALVLGAIAPVAVPFFGGAERIIRAAINLLQPLNQAVLPRLSFLQHSDEAAAARILRLSFIVMGGIGFAMSAVAFTAAPLLVRIVLGADYLSAVPLLRIMAFLPLVVAINSVLGIFWAVPHGYERVLLRAILSAGITNLVLAVLLIPRLGATGMAISAVVAELVVMGVLGSVYATDAKDVKR